MSLLEVFSAQLLIGQILKIWTQFVSALNAFCDGKRFKNSKTNAVTGRGFT